MLIATLGLGIALQVAAATPVDTTPRRPIAIEYSDAYYQRVLIHKWGSYVELPVFAAEYALGEKLLSSSPQPDWVKPAHVGTALALGGLFAVNTVTGAWNLWEGRADPEQRALIVTHSILM